MQTICYSDGEEYTGLRSGVIISSQISNGSRSFLGNSSVILNFVHNVSNTKQMLQYCTYDILFRNKTHCQTARNTLNTVKMLPMHRILKSYAHIYVLYAYRMTDNLLPFR